MSSITFKSIDLIEYPIFILPSDDWYEQDGIVWMEGQVLDDLNVQEPKLGLRRLKSSFNDQLLPLKRSVDSFNGLLKQRTFSYIDSTGFKFLYEKTRMANLKYHRIKKVDRQVTHSLLWLYGINFPIKVPRPPEEGRAYAGMLYLGKDPWLLYEYSDARKRSTRRKI